MNREQPGSRTGKSAAIAQWQAMLRDDVALLAKPGAHHKAMIRQAHALHQDHEIDRDDLLELADGALAFAMESLLDIDHDE